MPALSTAITGGPGESCAAGLLTLPAFPATFPCATLALVARCLGRQMRCENERPFQPGGRLSAVRARGYSSGALPFSMYAGDYRLWGEKSQFQGRRGEQSVVGAERWVGTARRWLVSIADLMEGSRAGTRPAPTGRGWWWAEMVTGAARGQAQGLFVREGAGGGRRGCVQATGGIGTWWNDGTRWIRHVVGGGVAGAEPPHKGGPNRPDRPKVQWSVVSGQWSEEARVWRRPSRE